MSALDNDYGTFYAYRSMVAHATRLYAGSNPREKIIWYRCVCGLCNLCAKWFGSIGFWDAVSGFE